MNLNFSILWFDDSETYFDSLDLEPLQNAIMSWGFSPNIKTVTNPEDFNSYSPFKPFDLIVIDENLEEYPNGDVFISDIRNHSIYTEIVFYSASSVEELWDAIHAKYLEGVYVTNRNDLIPKIIRVGLQSVRKVLDLENMRGIVMAEVGELDHLLEEIIAVGVGGLDEPERVQIFTRFYEGACKQSQTQMARLEAFNAKPEISKMLDLCDSDKRWQNLNRIWKHHAKLQGRDRIGDYQSEILQPRNFLAHGKPELQQDGSYVFHYFDKNYPFNDQVSTDLRKTILKYKGEFSSILGALRN
jgi:hypothetical protein